MTSLFIDRRGVELEFESEAIVFREGGERIGTVPIAPLTRVFLRGDVRLSAALLGKLGAAGVGVVVLSGRKGTPSLLLARPHNDAARRVEQIRRSLDANASLAIARDLVERKIDAGRRFSEQGLAQIGVPAARQLARRRFGLTVFMTGDRHSAPELLAQKLPFRDRERA